MVRRSFSCPGDIVSKEDVVSAVSTDAHSESPSAEALPALPWLELTAVARDRTTPMDSGESECDMDRDSTMYALDDTGYETSSEYGFRPLPQTSVQEGDVAISQSQDVQSLKGIGFQSHLQSSGVRESPPVPLVPVVLHQPITAMPCQPLMAGQDQNLVMCQIPHRYSPWLCAAALVPAALQSTCATSSNYHPSAVPTPATENPSGRVSTSKTGSRKKKGSKAKISQSQGSRQSAMDKTGNGPKLKGTASHSEQHPALVDAAAASETSKQSSACARSWQSAHDAACAEILQAATREHKDSAMQPSAWVNQKGNEPKPEIREKLLAGCTDNLCFLIRQPEELAKLNLIRDSGFQRQVQEFLVDPDFLWSSLAAVKMPPYQTSANYGISGHDSDILGVIVIKSSDCCVMPLKISVGIWLRKEDTRVLRRIVSQVVLHVVGASPLQKNFDIRRNRFTLEGVHKTTPIEMLVQTFIKDESLPEVDAIDLNVALDPEELKELQQGFQSRNLKLTGKEGDFCSLAEQVRQRFKSRPKLPDSLGKDKSFKGSWLPGTLFQCTLSESPLQFTQCDWRKELDGHIVVLLPWQNGQGRTDSLQLEEDHALVARVDTTSPSIYLVPRIVLHPVTLRKPSKEGQDCNEKKMSSYLGRSYKFKVLVRSGATWQEPLQASLCTQLVGPSRCLVQLRDDSDQTNATPVEVEVDAVTLAMDLPSKCLAKGQDATIVAYHG